MISTRVDFARIFGRIGELHGDRPAVVFGNRSVSFLGMVDRVYRLANGLRHRGVRDGTVVAMLANNCPELLEAFFARYILGAVDVTLNSKLTPREWTRQITESGATVVI